MAEDSAVADAAVQVVQLHRAEEHFDLPAYESDRDVLQARPVKTRGD
jgi:hypothetical protein